MPRANNLLTLERTTAQHRAVVGANILDGKKFTTDIENRNQGTVDIDLCPLPWRDRRLVCDFNPVTHRLKRLNIDGKRYVDSRDGARCSNCDDIEIRIDLSHQASDAGKRAGERTGATATSPLIMHLQDIVIEADNIEVTTVTL